MSNTIARVWDFNGVEVISTTEICRTLEVSVPASRIKQVCPPAAETANGTFWHVEDLPCIAMALAGELIKKAHSCVARRNVKGRGQAMTLEPVEA